MVNTRRVLVRFAVTLSTRIVLPHRFLQALLAVALAISSLSMEASEIEWIRQFGGAGPADDWAQAADSNGNVYLAGRTSGAFPGQTSAGDTDAFVRKYDADGDELWTRQFGGSGVDEAFAVAVDATGVYVAGTTGTPPPVGGLALKGSTGNVGGLDFDSSDFDAFVRKYDLDGNVLWTRQFGSSSSDAANAVSADFSGVYVAGWTSGTLPGQSSAGGQDAFIRKYDSDGNELWTRQFGSSKNDDASAIAVDPSGVYLAGRADEAMPGQTSAGSSDAFVRKYDANGNEVWTRQFGTASHDSAGGVGADVSGIYVVGLTLGTFPGQTSGGSLDAFVRKYDPDGNEVWTRQFGGGGQEEASGVSVDVSGVYVAGRSESCCAFVRKYDAIGNEQWTRQFFSSSSNHRATGVSVDFSGVYVSGVIGNNDALPGQTSAGSVDAFVRKYDTGGNEVWTRQFGGAGPVEDRAEAVAGDGEGSIYVAGITFGNLPGQTGPGGGDAYVRKYDADGNQVWTRQFGTSGSEGVLAIAVDASGVYVGGSTSGTFAGQTSAGDFDAFVRKYDADGNEVWTRQFGGSRLDVGRGVAVHASFIYVTGMTEGTLPGQTGAGHTDAFVRKYDADGNEMWTRQFGTSSTDTALGIAVDDSGVYLAGDTNGTFAGQVPAGNTDAFVRKYDASGNELWTRQFGSSGVDVAKAVAVDASAVYIMGYVDGTLPGQTAAGGGDMFVRAYDASGNELWTRQFGTTSHETYGGIAADVSGVYVAGITSGTLPGQTSAGDHDAFVRKYFPEGTEAWTRQFGTSSQDLVNGVALDSCALYLAGATSGTFPGQTSSGSTDAYVAKLSENIAPTIESISAPLDPVLVGTEITVNGVFSDPNLCDTHTALWNWDDGSTSSGTVVESGGSGTVSGTHTYTSPGVYTLILTVTDNRGASDSAIFEYVVVYDPEGGFVTGSGSFDSPAGAYSADPTLTGKARFGFVSKYQKGATTPTGETHFDFRVADFSFRSTEYEWLVVSGPKAQYKGSGTINGAGNYGFLLTATDGQVSGGGGQDKFRIKIWDKTTGAVIYDNQKGDADDSDATTVISGSIIIHK